MQSHKKFAFDVGITLFASLISLPLGFIVTIALGRYLGADDLGLYQMTLTIYGIVLLVAAVGIPAAMVKYVAEFKNDKTKINQIASSGVITSLLLGIGFAVLFYFSSNIFAEIFNMPRLSGLLKILSIIFPFVLVNQALLGLLNGLREMKKHATATIIQSILMVVTTIVLIYYGFGVVGAVIGNVVSSIGGCLYLIWISKNYFDITLEEYVPTIKKQLKFGIQTFLANAINVINYKADIILIGFFLTATDVGHYAIAVGFSTFFWIIPSAIQTIVNPATSELWANNNHSALQTMIDKSMKYTACILLPIGLGVGFFVKDVILIIFGEGFIYAVLPLQILIVGAVIFGIACKSIGGSLSSINRPDLTLKVTSLGAIINIILNILLIPYLGIFGAAIATTVSLILMSFIFVRLIIKVLLIKIHFKWFAQIIGIAIIAIFSFVIGDEFINTYVLGFSILIIYIVLIFNFFLMNEDKSLLKSLIYSLKIR